MLPAHALKLLCIFHFIEQICNNNIPFGFTPIAQYETGSIAQYETG